ncbi:hypothetical protein [Dankookia sp. P2]|uniref:hypothetical protein n=1 Tax=Dankookia sp. P2 TaxID=3423955 RepID=UPI003D66760A
MKHLLLGAVAAFALSAAASAQSVPAGPKVSVVAVTQPLPTQPQYTRVDVPVLKEGLAARSGGRIEVQAPRMPSATSRAPSWSAWSAPARPTSPPPP